MSLQDQSFSINFSQGLDSKTDPKLVIPGKLIELRDAVFTGVDESGKSLTKRNGYDALSLVIDNSVGTVINPKAVKTYKNELVIAATNSASPLKNKLFSYAADSTSWIDKGSYTPVRTTNTIVSNDTEQFSASAASNGTYTLTSWVANPGSGSTADIYFTITEDSSNLAIYPETLLVSGASNTVRTEQSAIQVVLLTATTFGIVYINGNDLTLRIITVSGSTVTVGAPVVLKNDAQPSVDNTNSMWVAKTSTGMAIFYQPLQGSTNIYTVFTTNNTGTVINTLDVAESDIMLWFYINVASNGNLWLYYTTDMGDLKYAVYSSSAASILVPTTISSAISDTSRTFSLEISTTSQEVYYNTPNTYFNDSIQKRLLTSAGVVGVETLVLTSQTLFCPLFTANSITYLPIFFNSTTQPTYFLYDLTNSRVVAKALSGRAAQIFAGRYGTPMVSGNKIILIVGYYPQPVSVDNPTPIQGTMKVVFDFDDPESYQALEVGESLIWNGSIMTQYDGQPAVELGFLLYPDEVEVVQAATTGGHIADGTYLYYAVYRWYDNQGNLHQSTPSIAFSKTVSAGTSTVVNTVRVATTALTEKKGTRAKIQIAVFRTLANQTVPHLINTSIFIDFNDITTDAILIADTFADSSIQSNEILYTTGGVLENTAPPSATIMTLKNNRLWVVDDENRNTIWPTKTFFPGNGLAFSDVQTEQVDERGGDITGLGAMDSNLVMFKESVPFFSAGDVGNDTGQGSTFTIPQIIPSDVGCTSSKSIVTAPQGIMRKTDKGIYLLDRSLGDSYFGSDVERYNNQDITSALIMVGKNQIRFLTSDGSSLLYDYFYNQWSVFTDHEGYGATPWNGSYVYVRSADGKIFKESTTRFLDDTTAYGMYIETAWIKPSLIQGFQRFKRVLFLGKYTSPLSSAYAMQAAISYNYVDDPSMAPIFTFSSSAPSTGLIQYRQFPVLQKCEAFKLIIQENATGAIGESISLTDMAITAGMKKGLFKLSAAKSIG